MKKRIIYTYIDRAICRYFCAKPTKNKKLRKSERKIRELVGSRAKKCLYLCVCRVCKKPSVWCILFERAKSKREQRHTKRNASHSTKKFLQAERISIWFSMQFFPFILSRFPFLSLSLSLFRSATFSSILKRCCCLFIEIFHKLMKQCDIESYLSAFVYVCVFLLSE